CCPACSGSTFSAATASCSFGSSPASKSYSCLPSTTVSLPSCWARRCLSSSAPAAPTAPLAASAAAPPAALAAAVGETPDGVPPTTEADPGAPGAPGGVTPLIRPLASFSGGRLEPKPRPGAPSPKSPRPPGAPADALPPGPPVAAANPPPPLCWAPPRGCGLCVPDDSLLLAPGPVLGVPVLVELLDPEPPESPEPPGAAWPTGAAGRLPSDCQPTGGTMPTAPTTLGPAGALLAVVDEPGCEAGAFDDGLVVGGGALGRGLGLSW